MTPIEIGTVLGSATAGLFARVICHPFDTIKAQIQANAGNSSPVSIIRSAIQKEGFRGLYNGIGVALVGGMPACCLYLTSYEIAKDVLTARCALKESPFTVFFASGMFAEVVSCILFVPVDVIKERLQVQAITVTTGSSVGVGGYRGSWDALRTIVRTEGIGRGLYRGFGITLFSFGPFSALYFSFYESLKGLYLKGRTGVTPSSGGGEASLPFLASLMLSATAGSAASLVTNPLDLVKLRIQIERRASAGTKAEVSGGVLAMLGRIWSTEGLVGLFRGAGARILFHAPNTAITMALFETCRTWWNRVLE